MEKLQEQFNIKELVIKQNLDCFWLVFTQPITDVFEQGKSSNRQKIDGCFFRQILQQIVSWILS